MKVLIADDSPVVVTRLVENLAELPDVEIIEPAQNVPEAIERVQATVPDVIVLDIQMPGGSGLDVLRTVKQTGLARTVILLTNHAYPQFRAKAMKMGADFFLDKSSEWEKALQIIRELAGRHHQTSAASS